MAGEGSDRMRRVGLGALLAGLNAGLVLLAVVGVGFAAAEMLERLADEQALARVDLAGSNAAQAVRRSAGDVLTAAQLLGERPTVGRLLREGDSATLDAFLDRFHQTSRLSGCAVLTGGRLFARSDPPLPWDFLRRNGTDGEASLVRTPDGSLVLTASSGIVSSSESVAVTALILGPAFTEEIAQQVGVPVEILPAAAVREDVSDPRHAVRERALETGEPASSRLGGDGLYLSVLPLAKSPETRGEGVAVVETSLPGTAMRLSLVRLEQRLLVLSLLVAAAATLSGFLISRRLARPVRDLTAAAARVGTGDLSTPMPRASGAELGTLAATMEDMRRRLLQLTSELRRRQAEGQAVLTGISEGVYSVDRDRRIRYLNPQTAALLGRSANDAVGRFCGDVLQPQGEDGIRPCEEHCPIVHARFRGRTSATEHLLLPGGVRRTVVITSAPPTGEQQFQVLRDETDQEAARRQRDAVLANISHEFKTPLSAQLASIELLRERLLDHPGGSDAETDALVLALERGSLRLTQLIDNLLESVRIEAGQGSIRHRPVALDEVVEEAVELMAPLVSQRGQRLEVDLPYPLPAIPGDAPRLIQVFVNLLANAHKFAPAGSAIRIGGKVEDQTVTLWVDDQGPGLPEGSEIDGGRSLFARFVRAGGRSEEPEQSGMGLGLWIVQSIVERHGGSVEARREEGGTRMRITLPREGGGLS